MQIDLVSIDELTNALGRGKTNGLQSIRGFTLGAAMELAIWVQNLENPPSIIGEWAIHAAFRNSVELLRGGESVEPQNVYERVWEEIRPIRSCQCISQNHGPWNRFLERFAAALKAAGFVNGWNQAMAGVLHEMADNVVQHSTLGSGMALNGLVGYSVSAKKMAFTVADNGVGAVRTLQDNPKYADVTNGRQALDLIAREKVSRRTGQSRGNGYSDLFRRLVSFNGRIRLRSADGMFCMTGDLDRCSPVMKSLHPVVGFYISVECEI